MLSQYSFFIKYLNYLSGWQNFSRIRRMNFHRQDEDAKEYVYSEVILCASRSVFHSSKDSE